jgi:RimJ/RimL family protein N-acetyltransferase
MSERLWGLDWRRVLPWQIGEVAIEWGSYDDILSFLREHGARLADGPEGRFVVEEVTEAKRRFFADVDVFVMRHVSGRVVGFYAGHPSDWSSYYGRAMNILPEFREGRLASEVSRRISETLAEKTEVGRIEVDTSIANIPMTRILHGLGFLVTGSSNSERWGAMLRFTKFLREKPAETFRRQFVYVPSYGRNPPDNDKERRER